MTKKSIWRIVVLVCVALVGILGMQVYSIVSSFNLNSELFDNNVHNALDHLVTKLEQKEIEQTATMYDLPRLSAINKGKGNELASFTSVEEISSYLSSDSSARPQFSKGDTLSSKDVKRLSRQFKTKEVKRTWKKGDSKKVFMRYFERYFVHHGIVKDIPVQQRVSINSLDKMLLKELKEKGITTPYAYAVFSEKEEDFVMTNHACDKHKMMYTQPSDFRYSISLFPSSNEEIAKLYIDFPTKVNFLWSGLWFNILSTILFTGIVVFCFYYTINIILTQKKLSEMKNDFLNNMTHEFKTPIATISIATDTIKQMITKGKADMAMRFVNIIDEENKRMNSQVGKVLQMARIDKREFRLNIETVQANNILESAAEKISLQVEQKGGNVTLDLQAKNDLIEVDVTHFTNIIHNLLDNANKYTPEKPQIIIRTQEASSGLQIEIEDNGVGIDKEARKQIFDKFYRVPTGNLHDVKGFGLGLSYVQAIVTAHGGTIDVKSELGKGSTFIIIIPHQQNVENG